MFVKLISFNLLVLCVGLYFILFFSIFYFLFFSILLSCNFNIIYKCVCAERGAVGHACRCMSE